MEDGLFPKRLRRKTPTWALKISKVYHVKKMDGSNLR